jgi:flavin reductase (DIM6/NTAB) family NADH-FMN oxidoreductase RutF
VITPATQSTSTLDSDTFRDVISNLITAVSIISTQRGDERFGVTASSVTSLSLSPASILVCLNQRLAIADVISETGVFAVNILGEEHGHLATQFSQNHEDKFRGTNLTTGDLGNPVLSDALAHLECRLVERKDFASHAIFIAQIESASYRDGSPLAYWRSSFGNFGVE